MHSTPAAIGLEGMNKASTVRGGLLPTWSKQGHHSLVLPIHWSHSSGPHLDLACLELHVLKPLVLSLRSA